MYVCSMYVVCMYVCVYVCMYIYMCVDNYNRRKFRSQTSDNMDR